MSQTIDPAEVFIETDRLIIRPPAAGDGPAHHTAVRASLTDLRKPSAALPWAHHEQSVAHSDTYCAWASCEFAAGREFPLLFTCRHTNQVLGASGLHSPDWDVPSFEIGWWGHSGFHGQGLFSEGARAVIDWGFDVLMARRIFAEVDDANTESWRLCERIGMQYEGLARNARITRDGELRDCRIYAATR